MNIGKVFGKLIAYYGLLVAMTGIVFNHGFLTILGVVGVAAGCFAHELKE